MNPYILIAAITALAGSFGMGFHVRGEFVKGHYTEKMLLAAEQASDIIEIKNGEIKACQAELSKVNSANAENIKKNQRLIADDIAAREAARAEARARDLAAAEANERVREALISLRGAVDDATETFGACAGESMPDNFRGLLNDAINATEAVGNQ